MVKDVFFSNLIRKIRVIIESEKDNRAKLEVICHLLRNNIPGYDWVGFYLVDPTAERELVLGPYSGEPTKHTHIKFGQGICGQAVTTEKTFIVDDVSKETNYLSCSINVKSEIVVPIFKNGNIVGELDIDSHIKSAFTDKDEQFLSKIGELTADLLLSNS